MSCGNTNEYCEILIICPGLIFVQKAFFAGLILGAAYFRRSFLLEGILRFKMGRAVTIKIASTNSPWAYIREGLLSEGYLRLRFGGLIFGRTFFLGGGGAYYRNFISFNLKIRTSKLIRSRT